MPARLFGAATNVDLGALGMPGCMLLATPGLVLGLGLTNPNGSALLQLPLPGVASLAGITFYNQVVVIDPPANAIGATTSNAGIGVLGIK